jgi:hypothetical protein
LTTDNNNRPRSATGAGMEGEMSDQLKDGGPAFPGIEAAIDGVMIGGGGMTLRDWFAGQALAEILPARDECGRTAYSDGPDVETIAADAYTMADAMLKARAK